VDEANPCTHTQSSSNLHRQLDPRALKPTLLLVLARTRPMDGYNGSVGGGDGRGGSGSGGSAARTERRIFTNGDGGLGRGSEPRRRRVLVWCTRTDGARLSGEWAVLSQPPLKACVGQWCQFQRLRNPDPAGEPDHRRARQTHPFFLLAHRRRPGLAVEHRTAADKPPCGAMG
jgi:hypothetical protein